MDSPMKILVVDDNRELAETLGEILTENGYEAAAAFDGQSAIELWRREKFGLALLDYDLPDLDGLGLQERLSATGDADFIIVTAYGTLASAAEAVRRKQVVGYETKPLDMGRLLALIQQISARRQAEARLRASEAEYRTLFREMLDGFALHEIICNEAGRPVDYRFLAVNPAFERMTGLKAEQIIGRTVLEALPGTEMEWIENYGQVALTGDPIFFERYSQEIGKHFEVSAFRPAPGRFVCIFQDITDRKRIEEQRRRLQKAESLNRMAGAIAHHYNNLLYVVLGNLELALENPHQEAKTAEMLADAMSAARRATELGGVMLAYLGQGRIRREPLDLSAFCRRLLPEFQGLLGTQARLDAHFPEPGLMVAGDAEQIRQVLCNLIINAGEAICERQGMVMLRLIMVSPADIHAINRHPADFKAEGSGYACLEVADTGCGIAENALEKLFDPFYSTKVTGRGLGLALALGVIKSHDGCIAAESVLGQGSVFRVFLPLLVW